MAKEAVKNAEALNLSEIKTMLYAAENHGFPVLPAKGPCGGCDLVIKPKETAKGPCGGCDVITKPKAQGGGACGGCDVMK
jgi:hypothetical protein